jgi:hypothetical protein
MSTNIPGLSGEVRRFIIGYWDTDVREVRPSAAARADMRKRGIEGELRKFLSEVILREVASPEAWSSLVNAQTDTAQDVRRDATELWNWLYDGAALPKDGGGAGAVTPPQV